MLKGIGEFYSGERATQSLTKLRDGLHDREQLRFADRGGSRLFVDRGHDGVTKVLCGAPGGGGVELGVPVAAPLLAGLGGSRQGPQEGQKNAGRAERDWVVAALFLRLDLAPPDLYEWFKREETGLVCDCV